MEHFEINFFSKNSYIYHHFRTINQKIFGFLSDFCSAGLPKLPSMCPEEHYEEKYFFQGNYIFSVSSDIQRIFFSLLAEFFQKVVQTAFYLSRKTFWRIKKTFLLLKNWYFFTIVGHRRKTSGFQKNFRQGCQNCILTAKELSDGNHFLEEKSYFFRHFRT